MRNASVVIVGNKYLKNYALNIGKAKKIIELPTVVNLDSYPKINHVSNKKFIKVGWIGTPNTIVFLKPLFSLFEELSKVLDVEFVAIGVDSNHVQNPLIKTKKWSFKNGLFCCKI